MGMVFLPESPRWLIKKGRDADANRALARLLGCEPENHLVAVEAEDIRSNLEEERQYVKISSNYFSTFID